MHTIIVALNAIKTVENNILLALTRNSGEIRIQLFYIKKKPSKTSSTVIISVLVGKKPR